jgi:hypothetical protein
MKDCYWSEESFLSLIGHLREIRVIGTEGRAQVRQTHLVQYWNKKEVMDRTAGQAEVKLVLLPSVSSNIRLLSPNFILSRNRFTGYSKGFIVQVWNF